MSVSAVGGERSLALARAAADAEYFASVMKAQESRAQELQEQRQKDEEKQASKPISVVLGGQNVDIGRDFASALMGAISASMDAIKANPTGVYSLPNGLVATGEEILAAQSAFILNGVT